MLGLCPSSPEIHADPRAQASWDYCTRGNSCRCPYLTAFSFTIAEDHFGEVCIPVDLTLRHTSKPLICVMHRRRLLDSTRVSNLCNNSDQPIKFWTDR